MSLGEFEHRVQIKCRIYVASSLHTHGFTRTPSRSDRNRVNECFHPFRSGLLRKFMTPAVEHEHEKILLRSTAESSHCHYFAQLAATKPPINVLRGGQLRNHTIHAPSVSSLGSVDNTKNNTSVKAAVSSSTSSMLLYTVAELRMEIQLSRFNTVRYQLEDRGLIDFRDG